MIFITPPKSQYSVYRSLHRVLNEHCLHASAVVFDLSVPVFWLFHAPDQITAIVVLPSLDLECGTVCVMNRDHLTSLWLHSETNWSRCYL